MITETAGYIENLDEIEAQLDAEKVLESIGHSSIPSAKGGGDPMSLSRA